MGCRADGKLEGEHHVAQRREVSPGGILAARPSIREIEPMMIPGHYFPITPPMSPWLIVVLSLFGLGLLAETIVLYLLWRRLSGVERRMESAQSELPNELRKLTGNIHSLLKEDLHALKSEVTRFIDQRASRRVGGLSCHEVLQHAVRVSADGEQTFDETDLVRRLGSHISDVLEAMPEAKIFIDLRHGSIQGDDRPSSPVRWACGGLFAVGLEGPADDASVLEKIVTLLESVAKVDLVKALSVFLKSRSANRAAERMNAILKVTRSTFDFLKTSRMTRTEAAASYLSRLEVAIVLGGYNVAEQIQWSTETGTILFDLHAIGRHAAHELDRFTVDLPTTGLSSIRSGPAVERVNKLRSVLNEFRETAYVAQLSMLAQLLGLNIYSLLDISAVRIDGEVAAQLEYFEHLKMATTRFATTLRRLLDKKALDAVFQGSLEKERQEAQTIVDNVVADLKSVERDASAAMARIRSGERLLIPTDALKP